MGATTFGSEVTGLLAFHDQGAVVAYRDPERQREAERRWYRANRQAVFDRKNRKKARLRTAIQRAKEVPCADCLKVYPYYVMDFDHVQGVKVMDISRIVNSGSVSRLEAEIAKCEIVCANCHRERTWQRSQIPAKVADEVDVRSGEAQLSLLDRAVDGAPTPGHTDGMNRSGDR